MGFFACDFCLEAVMFGGVCLLWVFLLAFHALRPRYGVSRLLFYSHAQFPLRDISISFQGGLFCLLFTPYAHAVGFPAYLFYSHAQFPLRDISISFQGGLFCLLFFSYAHAVGFPAYFSTHTPKSIYSSKEIMYFL